MTETSPKLGLPYIQPAQAQKHVTHNEAIRELDTLVQLRITEFGTETAPGTPALGETHALGPVPGGAWAGQGGQLATWDGEVWQFLMPLDGWLAWDENNARIRVYSGGLWAYPDLTGDQFAQMGISTAPDATNRLAVASDAVLLSHAGTDHRLKVNKAAAGDTASLLFQSDWTGHAEMGLAGDTAFSLKVSADGSGWTQVMRADPAALQVDVPLTGSAVQSSATDTTPGRLMRADYGYGPGNILGAVSQSAGVPTGAVIERGANANGEFLRFADGTQICQYRMADVSVNNASAGGLYRSAPLSWTFPATFVLGTQNGANVFARVSSPNGLGVNVPYGGRTTEVIDARAFAVTSIASTEIYWTAIGRWFQ